MIAELTVSQLAIIEQTTLRLEGGLTVLTGETGAGKSLLIDAIQLALGERADAELVRDGAKSANVSVAFDLAFSPEIAAVCGELGVPLEDSILYVSRDVFAEGRSQCRLGGRLMPASVLRQIGETLVDLHGQHDHQSLLHQERHLDYLDLWIGEPATVARERVREAFREYSEAKRKQESLRADVRSRDRKLEILRHQVEEIEGVNPKVGEFQELETTLNRLQNLERLLSATETAKQALSDADGSAVELMGGALKALEDARKFDPVLAAIADQLRELLFQLEDVTASVSHFSDGLDGSTELIDEVTARLDSLKKLRRKYGESEFEVLALLEESKAQIETLENNEASEELLESQVTKLEQQLNKATEELSHVRTSRSRQFGEEVERELRELALENARFGVGIKPTVTTALGADEVEFAFSANPGEPLRPLHRVASGGEVSRLMLALKTALAGKAGVPTLIFDEIDTGLGGRVGSVIGHKLLALSNRYQVVVISHLPQVAALANTHYRIEKTEKDGRTSTQVRKLGNDERVQEIARMLAGEKLTDTAIAHAREMLHLL